MGKLVYLIHKHKTFYKKDNIVYVIVHLHQNVNDNTYTIFKCPEGYFGTKANINYLKNRPSGPNLLYVPFLLNDEIKLPEKRTVIKTLDDLKPFLPMMDRASTFNQFLQRAYLSKAELVKKQLKRIQHKHAYLAFRHEDIMKVRTHFDIRIQVGNVLKSFVSNSEKLPNDYKRKMFVVESEDHPMTWAKFEGVIPCGYGMGYTEIIDKAYIKLLRDDEKHIKFEVDAEYLKGIYSLVKINKNVWVFTKTKDTKQDNKIFSSRIERISRPSYLTVSYKYNLTMSPAVRAITYLQDSIEDKHLDKLYEGKEELFISPVYFYKGNRGCIVSLDFDGRKALSDVKKFLNDVSAFGLEKDFYVIYTGNGYHVQSFFGLNDMNIEDLKKFTVWNRYGSLDAPSSFRDIPFRVAFTYSKKNNIFAVAVKAEHLDLFNSKFLSIAKNIPSNVMDKTTYKKQLLYFLYAHDFLKQTVSPASKFLKFLNTFENV